MNAQDEAQIAERARELIAAGNPSRAVDVLRDARGLHAASAELQFLHALALAKSGSLSEASVALAPLRSRLGRSDRLYVETQSLAGRIAKDQWERLDPSDPRRPVLARQACEAYMLALEASGALFPGINAATMGLLAGDREGARQLAARLRAACAHPGKAEADRWSAATEGEALLLLGDVKASSAAYACAVAIAGGRAGDVASMRRQARMLAPHIEGADAVIATLRARPVVVFAGHMIDDPRRQQPRFPATIEGAVANAIRDAVSRLDPGVAYSSAACGADILFVEEMVRRGVEVNILLPFRRGDFVEMSVRHAGDSWVRRFERVLEAAASVTCSIDEGYLGDRCLFEYNSLLAQGLALLRAGQLTTHPVLLSVLERGEAQATGGTLETVAHWKDLGLQADVIDLGEIRATAGSGAAVARDGPLQSSIPPPGPRGMRSIKTMLFADVAGFSRLQEEDAPLFFFHFLGKMAAVIDSAPVHPRFVNTWGDGLFVVFDRVEEGAEFALRLRDAMNAADWSALGLPAGLTVRIGMHSGPVFETRDPVLKRQNYFGAHVNRAARIEPLAAPGSVYVSEQTAALLAASGCSSIACDYVGSTRLPKDFGSSRLLRMRRAREFE